MATVSWSRIWANLGRIRVAALCKRGLDPKHDVVATVDAESRVHDAKAQIVFRRLAGQPGESADPVQNGFTETGGAEREQRRQRAGGRFVVRQQKPAGHRANFGIGMNVRKQRGDRRAVGRISVVAKIHDVLPAARRQRFVGAGGTLIEAIANQMDVRQFRPDRGNGLVGRCVVDEKRLPLVRREGGGRGYIPENVQRRLAAVPGRKNITESHVCPNYRTERAGRFSSIGRSSDK